MLQRRFSSLTLLMLSINGMVGSAWLFAPLYAAKIAGSGAIMAWLIGGLATAVIALTFAELSVLFPVAGGTAQIPQLSHGTVTSFAFSWIAWLSALTMAPIEVQAVLQYAATYKHFSSLIYLKQVVSIVNGAPIISFVPILTTMGRVWAAILMLGLCVVNVANFKGFVRFNTVLFWFKTLVIVVAVVTLLHTSFHPKNFDGIHDHFSAQGWQNILKAVAMGGIAFAFTGFKHGVELAGEAKNKRVAIPLAIVGSVIVCLLLYVGLQIAFIAALDPSALSQGWGALHFVGDVGPFAGLASALGLMWLLKILYIDAAVSPLGAGLIYVTSTARIPYAMSQIGFLPSWLTRLNKQNLPIATIILNFVIGMCLFLPLPGWQAMVGFLVSGMVISYAMGPIALLCLRREMPLEKRSFKLPLPEILCFFAFYCCNLICYWTGWNTIYKLAIAMAVGFIFLVMASVRGKLQSKHLGFRSALWVFPYLGGLVLISYLGSFGGGIDVIHFGWDFLVIAVFSWVMLIFAVKSRSHSALRDFEAYQHQEEV